MSSARDLVTRYLFDQADEAARAGAAVAEHDPDGVHDLRVACRRTRSVLRAHRRLLLRSSRPSAARLVGDLRQVGLDLSGPRDDEVARELVTAWARDDGWPGAALDEVLDAVGGPPPSPVAASAVAVRASSLAAAVRAWANHAQWRGRASGSADDVLPPVELRTADRLARRVDVATAATGHDAATSWHEVRKAAKRVRYAAEVALPAVPACKAVVKDAKGLQSTLGDSQDAQAVLTRLLARPAPTSTVLLLAAERARRAVREAGDAAPGAYEALRSAVAGLS